MHNKPHTIQAKEKISSAKMGIPIKHFNLPQIEIVNLLLTTCETTRSLASKFSCSDSAIKIIFRKHTTASQRIKVKIKKQSLSISGAKAHNWRGGVTPEIERIRSSAQYKHWRTQVFIRDKYTCQKCFAKSGNGYTIILNAHHIKSFALFPNERFSVDNGITLCEQCHIQIDTCRGKSLKNLGSNFKKD